MSLGRLIMGHALSRPTKVLLVTTVAVFMALLDVTIVNVAFPSIAASFPGASVGELSWVLNAYNVVFAALLIPAGRLADRLGRRRAFFAGLWVFIGGSVCAGAAPSPETLICARILQAAGAAILLPASLGLVLPEYPVHRRAVATSVWAAAGAVAAAAGPSVGGVLVEHHGWRWVFFVNVVIAVAILPGRRLLVEHRDSEEAAPLDLAGAALLAAAVGALALGIVKAPDWGWTAAGTLGAWAMSAALIAWLIARSARHPAPIVEPALLRVGSFTVANLAFLLFAMGFYALLLGNILFLTQAWGYSILQAGCAVTPGPLAAAIAARPAGHLVERIGVRPVAVGATALSVAACLLYRALPGTIPDYVADWLPVQLLSGVAIGSIFSVLAAASVMDLPPGRLATGTAMTSCSRQIGAVLGIAGLVAILAGAPPWELMSRFDEAWLLMAACSAAAMLVCLGLPARRPGEPVTLRPRGLSPESPLSGFERREIPIHGHTLVCQVGGTGEPVVLIHGLLESGRSWRAVASALAKRHTVIVPDLYGHGGSDAPAAIDYSLAGHAIALRDMLDTLGHEQVAVVGHSFGGGVAMMLVQLYPERVRQMVLISSGGLGRGLHPLLRALATPGAGALLAVVASRPAITALRAIRSALGTGGTTRRLAEVERALQALRQRDARGAMLRTLRAVIDRGGQTVCALDRPSVLARVPVLIMWGLRDRTIPVEHAFAALDGWSRASLVLLDGVGHFPHRQQPGYVAERVTAFLADQLAPGTVGPRPLPEPVPLAAIA